VNRHKVFLKQWEESEEGSTPVMSPTQVIRTNYPQFTDIPRDANSEDERSSNNQHHHKVEIHVNDATAAANSSLVDVNVMAINA